MKIKFNEEDYKEVVSVTETLLSNYEPMMIAESLTEIARSQSLDNLPMLNEIIHYLFGISHLYDNGIKTEKE